MWGDITHTALKAHQRQCLWIMSRYRRLFYFGFGVGRSYFILSFNDEICLSLTGTVEPVLRNHCHERPPVLKDH